MLDKVHRNVQGSPGLMYLNARMRHWVVSLEDKSSTTFGSQE